MIIGLVGVKGSGKSTIAKYLVKHHNFIELTFAQALKDICHILSGIPISIIDPQTEDNRKLRETLKDPIFNMTGREWLQKIGTELFRDHFDPDIWIKIIERQLNTITTSQNYVISDCRFENEYQMIKKYNGIIWIINRPELKFNDTHRSETEWNTFINDNDTQINNDGSIDDLHKIIDINIKS